MELSRRGFVTGAAGMAAAGAFGSATSAFAKDPSEVTSYEEGQYAFEIAPDPVDESEINETIDAEIVIVGAGNAGIPAALTAMDLGAKTVVLQKNPTTFTHGWAVRPFGTDLIPDNDGQAMLKALSDANVGLTDTRLLKLYIDHSGETIDFFNRIAEENGLEHRYVRYTPTSPYVVWDDTVAYHRQNTFMTAAAEICADHGVEFRYECPGYYLEKDENGRVTGVIAKDLANGGYIRANASTGVIVASGDIGNNEQMLERYSSIAVGVPSAYVGKSNEGEGQQMLLWAGAQIQKYPFTAMIHLDPSVLPEGNAPFSDYPWLSVNGDGNRFMDESVDYQAKIYAACGQTQITFFNIGGPEMKEYINNTEDLRKFTWDDAYERGAIVEGATVEELAEKIGVPADNLQATIDRYMEMYNEGEDSDFGKPIENFENTLLDEAGPFYAIKRSPGTLVVAGGAVTNERLQVLDGNNKVIEGLYVAGNTLGKFFGMVYYMSVMSGVSNGRAVTTGRLAARFALNDL